MGRERGAKVKARALGVSAPQRGFRTHGGGAGAPPPIARGSSYRPASVSSKSCESGHQTPLTLTPHTPARPCLPARQLQGTWGGQGGNGQRLPRQPRPSSTVRSPVGGHLAPPCLHVALEGRRRGTGWEAVNPQDRRKGTLENQRLAGAAQGWS